RLRVAGWDPGPLVDMARTAAATGARVAWQLTLPPSDRPRPVDGIAPFLIRWANDAPHPAGSAPGGCAIRSLRAEHPQPDDARRALDALGVHLPVARGDAPALIAHIDAPRGSIFLR
ncbi:MAG: VOC family protein, partial [Acidobacteriota bacterium]